MRLEAVSSPNGYSIFMTTVPRYVATLIVPNRTLDVFGQEDITSSEHTGLINLGTILVFTMTT